MTQEQMTARCWAEIDLDIVRDNYRSARAMSGGALLIPVLKADAYGLGAAKVAKVLKAEGAGLFAVAEYLEAEEILDAAGADVLVMGVVPDAFLESAVMRGIVATLVDLRQARLLNETAARCRKPARAHIKLDTGLHRLGFSPEEAVSAAREIIMMPHVRIEGLFTHLALRSRTQDDLQIARLVSVADALRAEGLDYGMLHALDSIGMCLYPEYRFDAVRAGTWLYGAWHPSFPPDGCRLAVRLRARIVQVRTVPAGECLGYDSEHPLARDSVIATVACGYYDGIPRANACGCAVVRGARAPIAGLVMMDQMTLDVTGIPGVRPGDAATLYGDGISLLEASKWYGVNRNELIVRLSRRVKRVYAGGREEIPGALPLDLA